MGDDVQSFAAGLGVEQNKIIVNIDNDYDYIMVQWKLLELEVLSKNYRILKLSGKYQ